MFHREVKSAIQSAWGKGKTIVLYGARQVGKTTLLKEIAAQSGFSYRYFDAEILRDRNLFEMGDIDRIRSAVSDVECVIIDEAQKIANVGSILKALHDHVPKIQWVASGSSSFDLAQKTRESMAGRTAEFFLAPLFCREIAQVVGRYEFEGQLEHVLRFGLYPAIFPLSESEAEMALRVFVGQVASKDLLSIDSIRKGPIIIRLLELLALQIGQTISFSELARSLGIGVQTVQKYVYLLEESFIVFSLRGFSRNLRNEVVRSPKIYFYDVGIRNAILDDFKPIRLRSDIGALWENFIISERIKRIRSVTPGIKPYFWRTADQREIDYLESASDRLSAYEIKWGDKGSAHFAKFRAAYPESVCQTINRSNWMDFVA